MVMAAVVVLDEYPDPTKREVREGLEGNLCRCTGYQNIVKAVLALRAGEGAGDPRGFRLRPRRSREEAVALLGEHGDEAKLLAGGIRCSPS